MKIERFRDCNTLAAEVVKFDLAKVEDLGALELRVRSTWSVEEVARFQHFILLQGDTATRAALLPLWERLLADCWRMVGAASVLHVDGAKPFKWERTRKTAKHKNVAMVTNDIDLYGREDALIYKTYAELAQEVGNAYAAMTNTQSSMQTKLDAYKKKFGPLEK